MLNLLIINSYDLKDFRFFIAHLNEKFCLLATNPSVLKKSVLPNCIATSLTVYLCIHQCLHHICGLPWRYTQNSLLLSTLLPTPETAHMGLRQSNSECIPPRSPILRKAHSMIKQKHLSVRLALYLDFSALYSRIPSAGPQICTRSSLVSFNKSAPGEIQRGGFLSVFLVQSKKQCQEFV